MPNLIQVLFLYTRNLSNERLKPAQNHLLNLWYSAVNSQRLLFSQKGGVKCSY